MADENQVQEPEQEQAQIQGEEQVQGEEPVQEPADAPQAEPAKKKEKKDNGGILLPILYALLAAVGAFTLVMIAGIVWTILTRPAEPSESPSAAPSVQLSQTQSYLSPDIEISYPGAAV